jgi:hypothetical protein
MYFNNEENNYGIESFAKSFYGQNFNPGILGGSRASQERIIGSKQNQISRSSGK